MRDDYIKKGNYGNSGGSSFIGISASNKDIRVS